MFKVEAEVVVDHPLPAKAVAVAVVLVFMVKAQMAQQELAELHLPEVAAEVLELLGVHLLAKREPQEDYMVAAAVAARGGVVELVVRPVLAQSVSSGVRAALVEPHRFHQLM